MPLIVRREHEGISGAAESAGRISFRINQLRLDSCISRGRTCARRRTPHRVTTGHARRLDHSAAASTRSRRRLLAVTIHMSRCNVVVIGASAGGVSSLTSLVRCLPAGLEAAVAVALHVPEESPSALPAILSREGPLRATHAVDAEPLQHGRIYVAPPGRHLLVKRRTLRSVNGPNENGHRPAVDPLFRTAARSHGRRTIGVVLSGSLDDGTAGLQSVKQHGGAALVQDPEDALFSGMPTSAIENVAVDFVGDVSALASELSR